MPAHHPQRRNIVATIGGKLRQDPDADVTQLRRELKAVTAESYIQRLVDEDPPLTEVERARLAALLLGARHEGEASAA